MINESKKKNKRQWEIWNGSGAVGSITTTYNKPHPLTEDLANELRRDFNAATSVTLYGENLVWERPGRHPIKRAFQFWVHECYQVFLEHPSNRILVRSTNQSESKSGRQEYCYKTSIKKVTQIEVKIGEGMNVKANAWWTRRADGTFHRTDSYSEPLRSSA